MIGRCRTSRSFRAFDPVRTDVKESRARAKRRQFWSGWDAL